MNKFKNAFNGLFLVIKDKSVKIQIIIGLIILLFSLILKIEISDFIIILLVIMMVISFEIINTLIEKLCDLYSKDYNLEIKKIKDISAGLVLISAIFSLIIGVLIFKKFI